MKKVVTILLLVGLNIMASDGLKTYRKRRALKKTSKVEPYGKIKKSRSENFYMLFKSMMQVICTMI